MKAAEEQQNEQQNEQQDEKMDKIKEEHSQKTQEMQDFMDQAIRQAKKAYQNGDAPIGCVIVRDGQILARAYNQRNKKKNTLGHAEILAIDKASKKVGDWRLDDCTMYVTLEPCQMCAGAILQARIPRVVIGCMNAKAGCAGSVINLLNMKAFNHQVDVITGVRKEVCSTLMSSFFEDLRKGRDFSVK